MYNINEVMIQTQKCLISFHSLINKLLSEEEEGRASEHFLKLERWKGPPHVNTGKQNEVVLSFKVTLSIRFIVMKTKRVSEDLSLLIKTCCPKLHSAPLIYQSTHCDRAVDCYMKILMSVM